MSPKTIKYLLITAALILGWLGVNWWLGWPGVLGGMVLLGLVTWQYQKSASWWWLIILVMPLVRINQNVETWMWLVLIAVWLAVVKLGNRGWWLLLVIVAANLYLNDMLSVNPQGLVSWDWERMNINNPAYAKVIKRYWLDDLSLPYRIRNMFYSGWLSGLLVMDSAFKILSPVYWVRLLGFAGSLAGALGLGKVISQKKYWVLVWLGVVVISSALSIMIDTKNSVVLALPAFLVLILEGLKGNKSIYPWVGLGLLVDILLL